MSIRPREYTSRDVRYEPVDPLALTIQVGDIVLGWVENLSVRGLLIATKAQDLRVGEQLTDLSLHWKAQRIDLPQATVKRVSRSTHVEVRLSRVACSFDEPPRKALDVLRPAIRPAAYVTGELRRGVGFSADSEPPPPRDIRDFAESGTPRLLDTVNGRLEGNITD